MATLKNRIETLKTRTSDLAVRQICESVLELTEHVPTRNLSALIRERLKEIDSQDAHAQRFIVSEKRLARLEDMGISRALDRIKLTGVWEHNPRIQYILEWYEKNQIMKTADFLIAEQFIAQMTPFCYDPSINEAIDVIRNIQKVLEEDIAVSTTIHLLENSRASKFYSPLVANLREYIENKSQSMRSVVISEMETYAYEPVVRELQNKLKTFESNSNKSKFHITATSSDYLVNSVYSFVLIERNADYFAVDGNFFKKVGESVTHISTEAMARINKKFVELNALLTEDHVSVDREKISYSYGNNTMQIHIDDKSVLYNGKPLKIQEVNNKLVEVGVFRWNQQDDLNKFNSLFEHVDTLCEIDFAKVISSKNHAGIQATIMRLGGSVTVVKNNPIMNENKVFTGLNGTQARNIILEFLNYDISESLVEFLSSENRAINQIENERRGILNQIDDCERNILKIEEAQQDILISGSDEVSAIKSELIFEIARLKGLYANKTNELNKLRTFEDKDTDYEETDGKSSKKGKGTSAYVQKAPERDYGIGDLVMIDGKNGRIVGLDSVQNKATVLLKNGDSVSAEFSDLELKVKESYLFEGKKSKGSKGVSAFTQQTPERAFNIGDKVDVADKGVGKITGIDSAEKIATVMFTSGIQSKATFPEIRIASDDEIEREEEYSEETSGYGKKKTQTTYVQEAPQIDFRVGGTVNVIGKGLAKITAIDSIRHIAIVMLQNGQQSEEEFSNLRSMESEIGSKEDENYMYGVSLGSMPNVNEQPLESKQFIEDIDADEEFDAEDDYEGEYDDTFYDEEEEEDYGENDFDGHEPTKKDIAVANRWAELSKIYGKDGQIKPFNLYDEDEDEEYIPEKSEVYEDGWVSDEENKSEYEKRPMPNSYVQEPSDNVLSHEYDEEKFNDDDDDKESDDMQFTDRRYEDDEEEDERFDDFEPSAKDIALANRWAKLSKVFKNNLEMSDLENDEDFIEEDVNDFNETDLDSSNDMFEEEYEDEDEGEFEGSFEQNHKKLQVNSKDALLATDKDSDYLFYDDELDLPDFNLPKPQYIGKKAKAYIHGDYEDSILSNKEVLVDEDSYYNTTVDEAVEIEINGIFDFVPKKYVNIIKK